jgi:hypothetical protein
MTADKKTIMSLQDDLTELIWRVAGTSKRAKIPHLVEVMVPVSQVRAHKALLAVKSV